MRATNMKYTINIVRDADPENPREAYHNVGTKLICWHRRYNLSDKNAEYTGEPEDFAAWAKKEKVLYLPVYLYDHGVLSMSTGSFSCQWDSGQVGYIYMTKESILLEFGGKILTKKAKEWTYNTLESEVKTYDDYLTGNVWGYEILDEEQEVIESCYGFFGEQEYCREEAAAIVKALENQDAEKAAYKGDKFRDMNRVISL